METTLELIKQTNIKEIFDNLKSNNLDFDKNSISMVFEGYDYIMKKSTGEKLTINDSLIESLIESYKDESLDLSNFILCN